MATKRALQVSLDLEQNQLSPDPADMSEVKYVFHVENCQLFQLAVVVQRFPQDVGRLLVGTSL